MKLYGSVITTVLQLAGVLKFETEGSLKEQGSLFKFGQNNGSDKSYCTGIRRQFKENNFDC